MPNIVQIGHPHNGTRSLDINRPRPASGGPDATPFRFSNCRFEPIGGYYRFFFFLADFDAVFFFALAVASFRDLTIDRFLRALLSEKTLSHPTENFSLDPV